MKMKKFLSAGAGFWFFALAVSAQTTLRVPADFPTIQAAVNASTHPLDVVQVAPGTYTQPVTITRSLIVRGPNSGTEGSGFRLPEAIVSDASFNISGSVTVTVDGMKFLQSAATTDLCILGGSAVVLVQNSVFERNAVVAGSTARGIAISSGTGAKTIERNLFTGDASGGLFSGHLTWNSGLYIIGAGSTVAVKENRFRSCRTAVNLDDFQSGITLTGNVFESNGTHLSFGGTTPTSGQYVLGANEFLDVSAILVNLSNVTENFRIDITACTLGGAAFQTYPLSTLFQIEQTMFHRGRSGRKGLVTYVPGKQYVVQVNPSIQAAINYGQAGQIIHIGPGNFNESVNLNKRISLLGSGNGADPASATILARNAQLSADAAAGVLQLAASGNAGDPLTLRDIRILATGMAGISVGRFPLATGVQVSHILLDRVSVFGSARSNPCSEQERGLYVDQTSSLNNLTVTGCSFQNLDYGWYLHKEVSADASSVDQITVTGTDFSDNIIKGLYAEKLSNALFDGCRILNNGDQAWAGSDCEFLRPFLSGFDINLKSGNYQNISIRRSEFTGNGTGQSKEGVALTFKARSETPAYNTFPATLSGVTVENCLITANERGLRFAGSGALSGVLVRNNSIQGNLRQYSGSDGSVYGNLINFTPETVNAACNWFGSAAAPDIAGSVLGAVTFVPFLADGNDGSTDRGFQPAADCINPSPCEFSVVCAGQGKTFGGGMIMGEKSDNNLARVPQKSDASGTVNFFSLGFNGFIVLKSSCPVKNGPGNDITVWETTPGEPAAGNLSERARIYASQDGIVYFPLGTATNDGSFDLGSVSLQWATYFRIQDATASVAGQPEDADGYDLDGIEVLNGYAEEATPGPAVSAGASSVCGVVRGKTKGNRSVPSSRSQPEKALGLPQNDQTINFFSLGFGGEICLRFPFAVFDGPGGELKLVETTFGNPSCSAYRERAEVSVSFDGLTWNLLGEFCQDQENPLDIGPANSGIQFVKIRDVSNRADFNSSQADGYDVDAVVALPVFSGISSCGGNSVAGARHAADLYDETSVPEEGEALAILQQGLAPDVLVRFTRQSETAGIEVRNAMGQLVESFSSRGEAGETETITLSSGRYAPGVYFVHLYGAGWKETGSFIR